MVAEVFAGLSAFKTMFDMAKGLKDISDAAIRNAAIIELQEQILAAQSAQSQLVEAVRGLEEKVAGFEKWETEKEKYERRKTNGGGIAFALKEEANAPEPSHYLCANCFEDRQKSYLQLEIRIPGMARVLVCNRCSSEIYTSGPRHPEHSRNPGRGRR
ncbi:MAG TPA: hypothetical protein VGF92_05520 [Stellaceae bacterium]|jgi:hypothetical protein